ncbi:lipoprotein-anchoring transpeptidase ErfK/SrfK [Nocardia transvalensis]|uniref:Lipoprotein-anchoring transpeptidase ErfK/SrfK n=1 Tax=Nocardia transvalensis TaxID=37333 RepID=A0A7W9UL28_9NOCA|nr:L,D-transpeptidase [Nocardia transvalensis]MBB5917133.1 lipoprotein-anchoring transpeptidase ErfK/SrfK [Nocardia transvalensis]
MRNTTRHLFLAFVIVALAAISSGTAAAVTVTPHVPPVQSITPSDGAVVGIAHPVTVRFAAPVADRAGVERSVTVGTQAGSFSWNGDSELVWHPTGFLPANTTVTVKAGTARTQFSTGGGTTADADMSAHTFTVYVPGEAPRVIPASMGKPGRETPVGTFPVMEKFRTITFDSRTIGIPLSDPEGYLLTGEFAERLTSGGVFVHSAPWSVDQQGYSNVSHGCINLPPDDAQWYYNNVSVGDPVTVHW